MISIIVPIYNAEKCLRQCLDSIIRQTYTDWQLILVNDGSTDDSAHICNEYEQIDRRIMVLHQSNKGVSSARNKGIENAQGEFLCFVDADDWLEETFLADFRTDSVDADFYISGWFFNISGKAYSYMRYKTTYCSSINDIRDEFLLQNLKMNGYPWGKLFRSSIIRQYILRFNENMFIHEDHLFILQYFLLAQSAYITERITYQYRVLNESGVKLSVREHSYGEYIENYESFKKVIHNMKSRWELSGSVLNDFLIFFVYSKRVKALESLVINNEKRYLCDEIVFWRSHDFTLDSRQMRIIHGILCLQCPSAIKWLSLKLLYKMKSFYYARRNPQKAILKHLNITSIVIK